MPWTLNLILQNNMLKLVAFLKFDFPCILNSYELNIFVKESTESTI